MVLTCPCVQHQSLAQKRGPETSVKLGQIQFFARFCNESDSPGRQQNWVSKGWGCRDPLHVIQ